MNNLPFVSVIVPVYNCKKMINKCIESLLSQNYPSDKYEIVIIDNKSNDGTPEVIKRYEPNVKYVIENTTQGSYAARNAGIRSAKGEILAFTDADCIASKEWLKEGVRGFQKDKIGCIAGEIKGNDPNNYVEEYLIDKNILSQKSALDHFFLPYPQTANAFYIRTIFEKIGYFEELWISGGDADFAWRMQLETDYKIGYTASALIVHKHRSTLKSMFKQWMKWGMGNVLLYKKYKDKMPERRLKETYWDFCSLIRMLVSLSRLWLHEKRRLTPEQRKKWLNFISFVGFKLGMFIGSIKNRVYYV